MIYAVLMFILAITALFLLFSIIWHCTVPFPNKYTAGAVYVLVLTMTLEVLVLFATFCIFGI